MSNEEPTRKLTIQLHVRKNSDVDYKDLAYVLLVFAKNLADKTGPGGVRTVAAIDATRPQWTFTDYRPGDPGGGGR